MLTDILAKFDGQFLELWSLWFLLCQISSSSRCMICVTLFCTRFLHGRWFFDSCNVQKHATKSHTSGHCLVWEALASLERCSEVILRIELKQSHCEILESVPAVFAKLSWNFHPSLNGYSDLAGNRQYITGLWILLACWLQFTKLCTVKLHWGKHCTET